MLELIHLKKTFNPGSPDARAALDMPKEEEQPETETEQTVEPADGV